MSIVTGIVQEVNNRGRGKGSNIVVNGNKYGCFDPVEARIDTLVAGEEVTFDTTVNGTYTNIAKAGITKTGVTAAVTAAPPAAAAAKNSTPYQPKGGRTFPIPALDGQRSIIRQNSLAHATSTINTFCEGCAADMELPERIQLILETAAQFEEFSSGDDIEKQALAAVAELGTAQA